ncbi:MAG: hypothetical protein SO009_05165 [Bacilli bacterium]|nr:hypothetical protein [Bacilli bacterium]
MDKENVTKLEILHGYDDYLDSLNRKLDYISDQLYSGDKHSIDELTDLVLYVEVVNFELLKFYKSLKKIGEIENKHNRILDIIFKLSLIVAAILIGLGSFVLAGILVAIQYYLHSLIKKSSNEVADYIDSVIKKSESVDRRVEHYQEITSIKLQKQLENDDEEVLTEEEMLEFEKALEMVNALLNDEDVKEYSEHTRILARKYLEDAGAKGETLEELAEDLKTKAVDLKGGRTLTKDKK